MATMNISLPEQMKAWVEAQTADGRYSNSSDVIRDMIRRAQEREEKIAKFQQIVDEARAGGVSPDMPEDIRRRVLKRHGIVQG
jgi:antitoxin ParD1/3/4